jgi:rhomboid protease GluP
MRRIPATRWRRVMDWSLVLASQGIESEIAREESGYSLLVREEEYSAAIQSLLEYSRENPARRSRRRGGPPLPLKLHPTFHPAAWLWGVLMVILYVLEETQPAFKELGLMDSRRVAEGEWWRPFTAMGLHEDAAHLVSNLTFGVIFLGVAMNVFKAGPALLLSSLAGAGWFMDRTIAAWEPRAWSWARWDCSPPRPSPADAGPAKRERGRSAA